MLESPFPDIEAWSLFYESAELPVLRHSLQQLDQIRERANTANTRTLAAIILRDPLLTLRVLNYIEQHRARRQLTDITTIERALMMIGMEPFFRDFRNLPLVEDRLKAHPRALLGLLKVIARARRAAAWAREWAVIRHDLDVDEITVAALLRYVSDMLMWCFAPTLALKVRELQAQDRHLRSSIAQQTVFNMKLDELQMVLVRQWHLPELLTTLMDPAQSENPRIRNVMLACDLARHSDNGWDDLALPDDYRAIEELLHLDHPSLMGKLGLDDNGRPPASSGTAA
ncbi:HDOD domain-containing protein [Denitratisoma oestradiolicum]|uniref:Uncharacterized protein n=1 Tax=Denitratisoma oestradiolicum TaxID=311182 RepID=A0A6S6XS64_9PROT|nr:HDOD domain-containing protein [Denitratisoma oestradiolicum]TWO81931.1 histidine kinase [Denitratisoma oestradiolicum]CAB1368826.1 conserved protein of unknown function [Denitratisoma oestradiolicum]